ncbi:MAG: 3-keto-5-aminohexanoate cleavage protein [Myxococcota bacterium]
MSNAVWLEVAVNGAWTRQAQPRIPVSVDEIVKDAVACVEAGAAVIHAHAYDAKSGAMKDDVEIYAAIVEGIHARVDAIVYPTLPIPLPDDWRDRYQTQEALARRGLLEWNVVDPGSTNLAFYGAEASENDVYANPSAAIRLGLEVAARHRVHPAYACYEPGFVRLGAELARQVPQAPTPIYRFMFSQGFTFGFPPEAWALDAYVRLVEREAPGAPWMVAGLSVDILPLIPLAVARGGHVRVGLEDAPFASERSNQEWVQQAVRSIRSAGGEPASAAQIRESLKNEA